MQMNEPSLEFVSIDLTDMVTTVSGCSDPQALQSAAVSTCDCTGGPNASVVQDCTIV